MNKSKNIVYILECSDKTYYTGYSNDIVSRIKKHNEGTGAKYTRGRRPVKLIWQKTCKNKREALKEEYRIKQLTRKRKQLMIINS